MWWRERGSDLKPESGLCPDRASVATRSDATRSDAARGVAERCGAGLVESSVPRFHETDSVAMRCVAGRCGASQCGAVRGVA